MASIRDKIDDRTGYRGLLHALLLLNFPVNRSARWRYVWGGALALLFLVECITGTLLMTVYSPSESSAWGSVYYLQTVVRWGWLIRGVHHYASHMMLVAIIVHLMMVVLTAGYRKPKEFIFWSGLLLAGVVLAAAISGNPLPWDQKGYWAYQIETGILGTIPLVGPTLRTILVGGSEFGNLTLTRLYTLHVVVLPLLAGLLLVIHVALMRRDKLQMMKSLESSGSSHPAGLEPYWPYQSTRNLMWFVVLMGIVVGQVTLYPVIRERAAIPANVEWEQDLPVREIALQAPADPELPYVARPEWYVRFLFELRHMVDKEQEVLITGLLPVVVAALIFLMPFYERLLGRRAGYGLAVSMSVAGLVGVLWLTYTGICSDRLDEKFARSRRDDLNYAGRAAWLAGQQGVPPEGPTTLLRNDPKTMGPLLFAANCASCHRWNGHDGTGREVVELVEGGEKSAAPTASDLYKFASREWVAGFLSHPHDDKFFGAVGKLEGGSAIHDGDMAAWAEANLEPNGPITPKHVEAVSALLARESGRRDLVAATDEEIQLGIAIFSGTGLKDSEGKPLEFEGYCAQCHALKAADPNAEGGGAAPDLNGYGSQQWLVDFLRQPGGERFYGDKNIMPAFDPTQLSETDIKLLVDWMRGEWKRAETEPSP